MLVLPCQQQAFSGPIRECVCRRTHPPPGTTHIPWHLTGQRTGQYPHRPRGQGKRAHCLAQTHDGHLAPVMVPTAWAGQGRGGGREMPGTGQQQLVKLAQGGHTAFFHMPLRHSDRVDFWQERLVLLLLSFQAVPGSPNCK